MILNFGMNHMILKEIESDRKYMGFYTARRYLIYHLLFLIFFLLLRKKCCIIVSFIFLNMLYISVWIQMLLKKSNLWPQVYGILYGATSVSTYVIFVIWKQMSFILWISLTRRKMLIFVAFFIKCAQFCFKYCFFLNLCFELRSDLEKKSNLWPEVLVCDFVTSANTYFPN